MPKVFVSVDFEGLPFVSSYSHLSPGRPGYQDARRVASRLVDVVARELLDLGYDVVVADSHGYMSNVDWLELPRGVKLVYGYPRPHSMVYGGEGARFAVFLGYHGGAGSPSTLSHTYSMRAIYRIVIGGVEASEYLLNAYALGEMGVPVGLVAGSAELRSEVEKHTPWAVFVELKKSASYAAAVSPSPEEVYEELRRAVREAHRRAVEGELKPLKPRSTVFEVEFTQPIYADVASLAPGVERLDGRRIRFDLGSVVKGVDLLELIVAACIGAEALLVQR